MDDKNQQQNGQKMIDRTDPQIFTAAIALIQGDEKQAK